MMSARWFVDVLLEAIATRERSLLSLAAPTWAHSQTSRRAAKHLALSSEREVTVLIAHWIHRTKL